MNWNDAEAHCNRLGGHLASAMSPDEGGDILAFLGPSYGDAYKRNLWLGGRRKSDGTWIWSDGSKLEMGLGTWNADIDGSAPYCLDLYYRQWYVTDCSRKYNFLCSVKSEKLKGTKTVRLEYSKYQLDFTSFHVWYTYRRASNDLLKSWVDERVTGVELKWMQ